MVLPSLVLLVCISFAGLFAGYYCTMDKSNKPTSNLFILISLMKVQKKVV